jgi:O-antigen/teichoic acid export membrane protein
MQATQTTTETTRAATTDASRASISPDALRARELLGGTARIFFAEVLVVPAGVLTAAFLSRRFGVAGYGLWTLSTVLVVWVETNVAAALTRPAIKLVAEAHDWRRAASAVLRLYAVAGFALAALCFALAPLVAALLGEASLALYLRVLACEIPFFCLAQAHRSVLVARGRFRERALTTAARWLARVVFVVGFTLATRTITGALAGVVLASLVELIVCRIYVRPKFFGASHLGAREVFATTAPLVVSALCLSLFNRLDLMMLKSLGGTTVDAGLYGVAQNLALLPTLFSFSLAPVLLSTLSRALSDGDVRGARTLARQATRIVIICAPFVACGAGCAPEIVRLIFGESFAAAAPLFRLLVASSLALVMLSVALCVLTAAGRLAWTIKISLPMLFFAAAGHSIFIPRAGATGAAAVTCAVSCAGALAGVALVWRLWKVSPPAATIARAALVSMLAFAACALIPAPGWLVIFKLAAVGALSLASLVVLGEFTSAEIASARALLTRHGEGARKTNELQHELELRSET